MPLALGVRLLPCTTTRRAGEGEQGSRTGEQGQGAGEKEKSRGNDLKNEEERDNHGAHCTRLPPQKTTSLVFCRGGRHDSTVNTISCARQERFQQMSNNERFQQMSNNDCIIIALFQLSFTIAVDKV